MHVTVRPFVKTDQAAAEALIYENLAQKFGTIDHSRNPDLADIDAHFGSERFLVAYIDRHLVGTGGWQITDDGQAAQIVRMHTHLNFRRRGIARQILLGLETQIASCGIKEVVLETTHTWEDAIAFYETQGYRRTQVRDGDQWFAKLLFR